MSTFEHFILHKLTFALSTRNTAKEMYFEQHISILDVIETVHKATPQQKCYILCFCDTITREYPSELNNAYKAIIDIAKDETHESNKRSITNIFITLLKKHFTKLNSLEKEEITNICFQWLIDDSLVATQSNCLTCLDLLSKEIDWINEELEQIIDKMYYTKSVAFQSRAMKILKKRR